MVLELSNSYTHTCSGNSENSYSDHDLKDILLQLMEKNGIDSEQIHLKDNGILELDGTSNLKLHSLMLQVEELGLKTKYTKKTLIEIGC